VTPLPPDPAAASGYETPHTTPISIRETPEVSVSRTGDDPPRPPTPMRFYVLAFVITIALIVAGAIWQERAVAAIILVLIIVGVTRIGGPMLYDIWRNT
jgi:hypothetical protein